MLADPKEQAEHLMLIDLGRNDVGRVSEIGGVRLTEKDGDRTLFTCRCTSSQRNRATAP
ncbi:MAG: hypothetical protein R3F37_24100 [Candidatus Competibacteraceae bacterium]